jgi:uncharacterized membrane protein YdbT with pleckstrin-like domain
MTIRHLSVAQFGAITDLLPQHSQFVKDTVEHITARWWLGSFAGRLYPYITAGIVVTTPLFILLNVIQAPPTPDPVTATQAVSSTVDQGFVPLIATLLFAVPFLWVVTQIGKCTQFAFKYMIAEFSFDATGISARTGLFNKATWHVNYADIVAVELQSNVALEYWRTYNLRLITTDAGSDQFFIPGMTKSQVDKLLINAGLTAHKPTHFTSASRLSAVLSFIKQTLLVTLLYAALIYVVPAKSLSNVTPAMHAIILLSLIMFVAVRAIMVFRKAGLCESERCIGISNGCLGRDYTYFDSESVQATRRIAFTLADRTRGCWSYALSRQTLRSPLL